MKSHFISGLIGLLCVGVSAQQEQLYSHYDLNSSLFNPAYSGSTGVMNIVAISRRQWTDFNGAPDYAGITYDQPLNSQFALGLNLSQGTIGDFKYAKPLRENHISANASYRIQISPKLNLGVGLRVGLYSYNLDLNQLVINDPSDLGFAQNSYNVSAPMTGFGTYLYSQKFFVGLSSPQLIFFNNENDDKYTYNSKLHYYVTAGYMYEINDLFSLKTTTQLRFTSGVPFQADFNAHFYYLNKFSVGPFIRSSGDYGILTNIQVLEDFGIFSSWETKTGKLNEYIRQSFEIGIRYRPNTFTEPEEVLPRYF